ncbi:MAG: hypothetical protein DBY24_06860, partial [Prevotellaceae bacterium]
PVRYDRLSSPCGAGRFFSFDGFCSGFHSFPRPGLQGEEAPWSVRFSAFQWFLRGLRAVRFRSGVAVEVLMPIPIFPKGV